MYADTFRIEMVRAIRSGWRVSRTDALSVFARLLIGRVIVPPRPLVLELG